MRKRLWTKDALRREEVRGTFAIGIIAVYITLRLYFLPRGLLLKPMFIPVGFDILSVYDLMIVLWVGYLFFATIALAEDTFQAFVQKSKLERFLMWFSRESRTAAHVFFALGIFLILVVAVLIFWPVMAAVGIGVFLYRKYRAKMTSK